MESSPGFASSGESLNKLCEQPAVCTALSPIETPQHPEAVLRPRLKAVRSSLEGRGS